MNDPAAMTKEYIEDMRRAAKNVAHLPKYVAWGLCRALDEVERLQDEIEWLQEESDEAWTRIAQLERELDHRAKEEQGPDVQFFNPNTLLGE